MTWEERKQEAVYRYKDRSQIGKASIKTRWSSCVTKSKREKRREEWRAILSRYVTKEERQTSLTGRKSVSTVGSFPILLLLLWNPRESTARLVCSWFSGMFFLFSSSSLTSPSCVGPLSLSFSSSSSILIEISILLSPLHRFSSFLSLSASWCREVSFLLSESMSDRALFATKTGEGEEETLDTVDVRPPLGELADAAPAVSSPPPPAGKTFDDKLCVRTSSTDSSLPKESFEVTKRNSIRRFSWYFLYRHSKEKEEERKDKERERKREMKRRKKLTKEKKKQGEPWREKDREDLQICTYQCWVR